MGSLNNIQRQHYQELQKQVENVKEEHKKLWVMLSLERLWQPFLFSTQRLGLEVQDPIREIIEAIWKSLPLVEPENHNDEDITTKDETTGIYEKENVDHYKKLLEEVGQKLEEEEGSTNEHYESYLMDALYSGFKWFFPTDTTTTNSTSRWDLTLIPVDFITDWLLDTYLPKSREEEVTLYQESPWIQEELKRIQQDLTEIIKDDGKNNQNQWLTLKKKYQNLWIISPPSSS